MNDLYHEREMKYIRWACMQYKAVIKSIAQLINVKWTFF